VIKAAGLVDWRAADKLLSKRFPHDWSDYAARKAVFPDGVNAVAMAGFSIVIHDLSCARDCNGAHADNSHAIDVVAEKPPASTPRLREPDPDPTLN
jgi:hypothetical protein